MKRTQGSGALRARRRVDAFGLIIAVSACAIACGGMGGRGPASDPSAIVVEPAPATAPPVAGLEASSASEDTSAPFELGIGAQMICIRTHGKVYCRSDIGEDLTIGGGAPLEGIDDAVSLAVASAFGCAATRAGAVFCFGFNLNGQLGAKLRDDRSDKPVEVRGVTGARRVFAGEAHACALLRDGSLRCWGRNDSGQTGSTTSYMPNARELVAPEEVVGVKDALSLSLGATTTCAMMRSRDVMCWGHPPSFGSAFGSNNGTSSRPVAVAQLREMDQVSLTEGAACGIKGGEVHCWGEMWGLVKPEIARGPQPVRVGLSRAQRLKVTRTHACAVLHDATVSCWGTNYYGALGRGESTDYEAVDPEVVKGLPPAAEVVLGSASTCVVTQSREVYCFGMLGRRKEPVPVQMRLTE